MENQQHEAEETRHLKFKTLNTYTKILRTLGKIIGGIACIPLAIGGFFLFDALLHTASKLLFTNGSIEEATPPLVKSLTFLGTSFALFSVAITLMITSELIQCFLAIEENTYQSAQNTSSNQPPSSN